MIPSYVISHVGTRHISCVSCIVVSFFLKFKQFNYLYDNQRYGILFWKYQIMFTVQGNIILKTTFNDIVLILQTQPNSSSGGLHAQVYLGTCSFALCRVPQLQSEPAQRRIRAENAIRNQQSHQTSSVVIAIQARWPWNTLISKLHAEKATNSDHVMVSYATIERCHVEICAALYFKRYYRAKKLFQKDKIHGSQGINCEGVCCNLYITNLFCF